MNWDHPTYGELGSALCELTTTEEAATFWGEYIAYLNRPEAELGNNAAEQVAASNIGYLMGYYGPEERQRIYGLFEDFNVAHPVFGRSEPTASEAMAAGRALAMAREQNDG